MNCLKFGLSVLLSAWVFFCMAEPGEYVVPQTAQKPVIDGRIDATGEWSNALVISGAGGEIDQRKSQVYFSWDPDWLYVGMKSETPPYGKLVVSGNAVIHDDGIELWFAPPAELRTSEQYKFGEFQLIANSKGEIYAKHHNPGYGLSTRDWKADIRIESRVENDLWDIEIAIPAKAFGLEKITSSDWKMLAVRNFRTQPSVQKPFTPVVSFADASQYAVFKLRQGPAVKNIYAEKSYLPGLLKVVEKCTLEARIGERKITQSGDSFDLTGQLPPEGGKVELILKDQQGGICFKRSFSYGPKAERIWFTPESYIALDHDFGTGLKKLRSGTAAVEIVGDIQTVPGRSEQVTAAVLDVEKKSICYKGFKPPVPGCISAWIKPETAVEKPFRRYISTRFSAGGYFGLQDQGQYMLLFLHNFEKEPKNIVFAKKPVLGQWTHVALNLSEDRVEYYQNGIRLIDAKLPFKIDPEKLGDLVVGGGQGGFQVSDFTVYSRCLEADEVKVLSQGDRKIAGDISWFPSNNSFAVELNCNADKLRAEKLELTLSSMSNTVILKKEISLKESKMLQTAGGNVLIVHQAIPAGQQLSEGTFTLALNNPADGEVLMEKQITVKHYPWLNNTLGKTDKIVAPFTPLQASGNKVSCVLRDYTFGGSGWPVQINALGQDILAGPVQLYTEIDGIVQALTSGKFQIANTTDTAVSFTGKAEGAIDVALSGRMEFDGFIRYDLVLRKSGAGVPDRLFLDIPVKKEFATLFHAVGEGIRSNPAGFVPGGQGTVWKSRSIPQINYDNFIPYIWLGDDDRGICYAADWDRDWQHGTTGKQHDAVELFRHANGDVSIRLNLLNAPYAMERERRISFALMASPVKPQPAGWRGWSDGFFFKGTKVARCLYSPPYWGSFTNWTSRYPSFEDFGYIRKLIETLQTGTADGQYQQEWIERVQKSRPQDRPERISVHTQAAFSMAMALHPFKDKAVLYPYTCSAETAEQLAEYEVMRSEWKNGARVSISSYADYAIYYFKKMLEAGFNGIYDDNTFFVANFNWAAGDAYIDDKGAVRPSLGLWKNREYIKRQFFLMHEQGIDPWLTVHQTNANILPVLSMATNSMGMEWKYGISDFQTRFTPDYIRAVCQGRQGGFFPTVLDGISGGTPETRSRATRAMLAALLPHEVRPTCPRQSDAKIYRKVHDLMFDFGIYQDDCTYTAYWDKQNPVKTGHAGLLGSTYRRGNKLLVFCGSYALEDISANFTAGSELLAARNLETGESLAVNGRTVAVAVKGHDFVLLELELKP